MAWHLRDGNASWEAPEFGCQFDCGHPRAGLTHWRIAGEAAAELQLCALEVPGRDHREAWTDAYVRGNDLVVSYPPRDSDQVAHTVYYRGLSDPGGFEMLVSAETKLLESAPHMTVCHRGFGHPAAVFRQRGSYRTATDGAWELPDELPDFFLIRPADSVFSWMLFAHPQDVMRVSWRAIQAPELRLSVFPESLEKGVIRRARFQLRMLMRDQDEQQADVLWNSILQAAPPLAT